MNEVINIVLRRFRGIGVRNDEPTFLRGKLRLPLKKTNTVIARSPSATWGDVAISRYRRVWIIELCTFPPYYLVYC
jgi:hypothetical protein